MTEPTIDLDRLIALDRQTLTAQLVTGAMLIGAGIVAMVVLARRTSGSMGTLWFGVGLIAVLAGMFALNACFGRWERIVALRTAKRTPDVIETDRSGELVAQLYGNMIGEH